MSTLVSNVRTEKMLWWLAIAGAAVSIVLGILMLFWPKATLHVGAILFGLWLLVHGIIYIVNSITATEASGGSRALTGVLGLLFLLGGIVCLRNIVVSLIVIATLIGASWLVGGIVGLVEAFVAPAPGPVRLLYGLLGGLSVLGGLIVLIWPGPSLATLVVLTGIWLLVIGVAQAVLVLRTRPA